MRRSSSGNGARNACLAASFGLLLAFILLEAGLRLAGFTITGLQERRNRLALGKGGDYRILCLGESTTQGQYPPFLEESLNKNGDGTRFVVFDKGRSGTDTDVIVSQVESLLDEYRPDMVVAMMGINDIGATHVPRDAPTSSGALRLLRSFKTYKLVRLIWLHIVIRTNEEADLRRNIELRPQADSPYVALGSFYQGRNDGARAEAAYKKALELNPRNDSTYLMLGSVYYAAEDIARAKAVIEKALELDPRNEDAYVLLGKTYTMDKQYARAEACFKKALELDPENGLTYLELGRVHRKQGRFAREAAVLGRALTLLPKYEKAYPALASAYEKSGQHARADKLMRETLASTDFRASAYLYGAFAAIRREAGQIEMAREYDRKASGLIAASRTGIERRTELNYRTLKAVLDGRKVRLVSVQYPMRPVAPLKQIFEDRDEDIIFVDNERIFKDAVERDGLKPYFTDMFGGNFGHCTDKGNRLLAGNIAAAILRGLARKP